MVRFFQISFFAIIAITAFGGEEGKVTHESIAVQAPFKMPTISVPVFPKGDFPITDYGADAKDKGAKEQNAEAIRKAIDACHRAGGGRVVIPWGKWTTSKLHFKSNVNLHLDEGAILYFDDTPGDYLPAVRTSWEGMECYNYSPLVYAYECENIAITGPGKLQTKMNTWNSWSGRPPAHMEALKTLYHQASTGVPVEDRQMAAGENNLRPHLIHFNRCRNILLEDFHIANSPFWTIHLFLCESAVVRGLDIWAHGHNNDGIDPECTRNLLIENCRFDQGDDAISIKSGRNQDAWRLDRPSENIVIRHCTVAQGHQLLALGSELSGGIRNVYLHDCRFERNDKSPPQNLLFIKTNHRRGGFVENIWFERVEAQNVKHSIFGLETDVLYQWRDLVPTYEERLTRIEGIHVSHVTADSVERPIRILGDAKAPVSNISIRELTIGQAKEAESLFQNVEGVACEGIELGGESVN